MPSILFVCTANQFRSPIAAACFLQKLEAKQWQGDWVVKSAGTWALEGYPALPAAAAIGQRMGFSLAAHRTTPINPALVSVMDLILVMDFGQLEALQNEFFPFAGRISLLSQVAGGRMDEIVDPVADSEASYLDTAVKICNLIDHGFYKICARALKTRQRNFVQTSASCPPL